VIVNQRRQTGDVLVLRSQERKRLHGEHLFDGHETAVRWLRVAAFAFRSDGREVDWATYRKTLLAKHKAKRALIPLILALR